VLCVRLPQKTLRMEAGASHASTFSKRTTHLLCPLRQGPKAEKAREWGIPIVDMPWLESLLVYSADFAIGGDSANSRQQLPEEADLLLQRVVKCALFYLLTVSPQLKQ
jgi:BRCT domain type II-containing protein